MINKKRLAWSSVIIWMGVIFYFSSKTGTSSSGLSNPIALFLSKLLGQNSFVETIETIVRKLTHLGEYAVLGILVCRALWIQKKSAQSQLIKCSLIGWLMCIMYAMSDELHQRFIPGRSAMVMDVLIDSVGAAIGILIYLIWRKLAKNKGYN